jgi:hypothetical protein
MRSQIRKIRRPLTPEESESDSVEKNQSGGGNDMNKVIPKISLEHVSIEERRREAKKPLYLVRYE